MAVRRNVNATQDRYHAGAVRRKAGTTQHRSCVVPALRNNDALEFGFRAAAQLPLNA